MNEEGIMLAAYDVACVLTLVGLLILALTL